MKVHLTEFNSCFAIDLEAETKEEVVKFARFGIGKLKKLQSASACFYEGKAIIGVMIGKNQKNSELL